MTRRLILVVLAAAAATGCATHGSTQAKAEVDAVVIDEKARTTAAAVANATADSKDALKAADDVSTREPATPPQ